MEPWSLLTIFTSAAGAALADSRTDDSGGKKEMERQAAEAREKNEANLTAKKEPELKKKQEKRSPKYKGIGDRFEAAKCGFGQFVVHVVKNAVELTEKDPTEVIRSDVAAILAYLL